jgi:hypothetical protein
MAAFDHHESPRVLPKEIISEIISEKTRHMMTPFIHLPTTARKAFGACHSQVAESSGAMDWTASGRTKE